MPSQTYDKLLTRNYIFIDEALQHTIKSKTIFFAGCGLSSQLALLCVRTGFVNFVLSDGDTVEVSNFNRQAFNRNDLGKNKAKVLGDKINEIHDSCKIDIYETMLKSNQDIYPLIKKSDLVINTVDFGDASQIINKESIKQKKPVFMPLNVGYGAILIVIRNEEELADLSIHSNEINQIQHLYNIKKIQLSNYLLSKAPEIFQKYQQKNYFPQIGIAAYLASAITVRAILDYIKGVLRGDKNIFYYDLAELQ